MNTCILGLGSNIRPRRHIREAKKILGEKFKILKESRFVSTKAVGLLQQGDFMNGALLMTTELNFDQLRPRLKKIEQDLGRPPDSLKYGPRTIDIDILLYDDLRVNTPEVTIPHPRMLNRNFVMDPLKEIAPDLAKELIHAHH